MAKATSQPPATPVFNSQYFGEVVFAASSAILLLWLSKDLAFIKASDLLVKTIYAGCAFALCELLRQVISRHVYSLHRTHNHAHIRHSFSSAIPRPA